MLSVLSEVHFERTPITTQLNTGYSGALVSPADESAASDRRTSVRRPEPAIHGPVPSRTFGLSLFRFEGVALRVESLVMSLVGVVPLRVELVCAPRPAGRPRTTTHPVLTVLRLQFSPGFPLAYSGSPVEMSDLECALSSPLRIPKRARASLFSKLQRANGGCLGA